MFDQGSSVKGLYLRAKDHMEKRLEKLYPLNSAA